MIICKNVLKKYDEKQVLHIEELIIESGECFGLVGNNGAGKTTFFNALLDLTSLNNGEIKNNKIVVNKSEEWKKFTTSFIDESFIIGYLTPEEYFEFIAELRNVSENELNSLLSSVQFFFNDEVLGQKKYLRDLSKGNQKKAGIIASLIGNPKVIILDEPFANLDPTSQINLKKIIIDLKNTKNNVTILISSHDLSHISEVCDRIVILSKGNLVKDIISSSQTLHELEKYFNS